MYSCIKYKLLISKGNIILSDLKNFIFLRKKNFCFMATTMFEVKKGKDATQQMIRLFNTNIDGRLQVLKALTTINGIGDRIAHGIIRKSGISIYKRAGELTEEEQELLSRLVAAPEENGFPKWFLNHQGDFTTGKDSHLIANEIETNIRFLIERGKKNRHIRQCRLASNLKVRGQRTKSNGRNGRVMGVLSKK